MATSKLVINPLTTKNYSTWSIQCKMALMKDGLWCIVNKEEKRPADLVGEADAATQAVRVAEQTAFDRRSQKALATIVLSVSEDILHILEDPNCPVIVWRKLADQFQRKTWANRLHLRKRLYATKLGEGGSVNEHIKLLSETFSELSAVGDVISEEDKVVNLLASLPEQYSVLVTAMEASPEVPSMDVVVERLLHEELKMNSGKSTSDSALFGRSRGQRAAGKQKKSDAVRCFHCNSPKHKKKDCPRMKKDSQDKG